MFYNFRVYLITVPTPQSSTKPKYMIVYLSFVRPLHIVVYGLLCKIRLLLAKLLSHLVMGLMMTFLNGKIGINMTSFDLGYDGAMHSGLE